MHFVPKHSNLFAILAVFTTAALLIGGNGMNPVWPLMWVAPVPVLLFAAGTSSWRMAGAAAALSMLLGSLSMLYYLHFVLQAPVMAWLIPFSLASVVFAAGVLLFRGLLRRGAAFSAVIALPAFWTVCEYLASFAAANGTAGSLSYSQERFLPMLQVASLTGPWGITFLLLLFPAAIVSGVYLWRGKRFSQAKLVVGTALAVIVGSILFGTFRLAVSTSQQTIKVGLLDTDAVFFADKEPAMRELTSSYAEQAEKLAGQGAKIIVMPEKTGVLLDGDAKTINPIMQAVADRTGATLVFGALHLVGPDSFNEARIYRPGEPVALYHKFHMLPPFESNLKPGTTLRLLSDAGVPIGVAICKDMDFIRPALDYGRAGVGLMIDPAWDFKVDRTWHGHIAIMRGVEGGYAVAHAAKFGLLTVTDDRGRILGEVRTDSGPFTTLLVDVPLHHDHTVFERYGTWFPWFAGLLVLTAAGQLLVRSRAADR